MSMTAPPLKTDPKYGYFPWWPEDGDAWVHPDDVATARSMIPSGRIFRRDGTEGDYGVLHYGDVPLRTYAGRCGRKSSRKDSRSATGSKFARAAWRTSRAPARFVEIAVGRATQGEIRYQIVENGQPMEERYTRDDLKRVEPL